MSPNTRRLEKHEILTVLETTKFNKVTIFHETNSTMKSVSSSEIYEISDFQSKLLFYPFSKKLNFSRVLHLPSPVSLEPASMVVDNTLSSLTLRPIDVTMVDLVSELGVLLATRPCAPCIYQVLHPLAFSAPSTPFEIERDPIDQLAMYSRRRPMRNIKTPSIGTN